MKLCTRCNHEYPLTTEYFYVARASGKRIKDGWQSYCKPCWKEINAAYRKAHEKPRPIDMETWNTLDKETMDRIMELVKDGIR